MQYCYIKQWTSLCLKKNKKEKRRRKQNFEHHWKHMVDDASIKWEVIEELII